MVLDVDVFGAGVMHGILRKLYATLVITHDGCGSFLHISHVHQWLS
jgi:hypothetical protein